MEQYSGAHIYILTGYRASLVPRPSLIVCIFYNSGNKKRKAVREGLGTRLLYR